MLTEYETPGTDDWWLVRLATRLGAGFERMELLRSYRDGDAMLPDEALSTEERDAYLRFYRMNRLHVVELLRSARTSKQRIVGFRTGATGDEDGDAEAWRLWRASQMKRKSHTLFDDAADYGSAFIITEPSLVEGQSSTFRVTNGWTTAVEKSALGEVIAAVEVGYDALGERDLLSLWRLTDEGQVIRKVAWRESLEKSSVPQDGSIWTPGAEWDWLAGEEGPQVLPVSRVPVQEVSTPDGVGVWERHIDTIDRVNYYSLQIMQVIVTQAFRQAAVSSDDLPSVYPDDDPFGRGGQPVDYSDVFRTGPAALWRLPADAKLHQFTAVDPRPLREQRDDEVRKLAAFSSTPYYMLSSDSANNSAEGASLASESLLSQVDKMNDFEEAGVEASLSIAFEFAGDQARANVSEIETMWAPLKRPSLSEIGSAAQQAKQGGATQRWIDEHVFGMTPGERRQAVLDRQEEAMFSDVNATLDVGGQSVASTASAADPFADVGSGEADVNGIG